MRALKLTLLLLLFGSVCYSQTGYLFVKKGIKKVLALTLGDPLRVRTTDGLQIQGTITRFKNDTVYIDGQPVKASNIRYVLLKERPKKKFPDTKTVLAITAGSALTAAGLTLSKQLDPGPAALTGLVIGFGPLTIKHFGGRLLRAILRKKYSIGRKFRVQILDLSIPGVRAF